MSLKDPEIRCAVTHMRNLELAKRNKTERDATNDGCDNKKGGFCKRVAGGAKCHCYC